MKWPYVLGLGYSMILAFIYGVCQLSLEFMLMLSNVLFPVSTLACLFASFWTLKRYVGNNPKPMFAMAWTCCSLGIFLWFLSHITSTIYTLVFQANPYPSFADVLWLSGYVPLYLAMSLIHNLFRITFSKKMLTLQLGITVALSATVSYLLVVPIIKSTEDPLTLALSAAYPIIDLGLFALGFANLLIFKEGSIGKTWFFITLSIILNIAADLAFTYGKLQDFYYRGHPLELLWLWGYVAFLLAIYIHRREL